LGQHLGDDALRDVKEASQVYCGDEGVVGRRVLGEWLGDEDLGVVYQGVHASKPFDRSGHELLRGRRIGDVARDCEHPRVSSEPVIVREFATTA
jgi:hypothetical protein